MVDSFLESNAYHEQAVAQAWPAELERYSRPPADAHGGLEGSSNVVLEEDYGARGEVYGWGRQYYGVKRSLLRCNRRRLTTMQPGQLRRLEGGRGGLFDRHCSFGDKRSTGDSQRRTIEGPR